MSYIISSQTELCEKQEIRSVVQDIQLTAPEESVRKAIVDVFGNSTSLNVTEFAGGEVFRVMTITFGNMTVPDNLIFNVASQDENGVVSAVLDENDSPLRVTKDADLSQLINTKVLSLIFVVQMNGTQDQNNDTQVVDKFVSRVAAFLTLELCGMLMQTFFLLFLCCKKLTCMSLDFFFITCMVPLAVLRIL